jgi:hypothetical protein
MDIVFRVGGEGFECALFAELSKAERVAQIKRALSESKTWGEFRRGLPDGEWEDLPIEWDEEPPDDYLFSADVIPGYSDGDYPEWLQKTQLEWFPEDLTEKYGGEVASSMLNGPFLELPADRAEEIAEELRLRGHTVEKTDLDIM